MTSNYKEKPFGVSPTLLCCNPLDLRTCISELNDLSLPWYHIDIMDGHFVPNLAIGMDWLSMMIPELKHPTYVHLMVDNPLDYTDRLAEMGVQYVAFHVESSNNPFRLCKSISDAGMIPCIVLNPSTPVEGIGNLLTHVGCVTLMGIEPGFSGQVFFPFTYEKISRLREMIGDRSILIEVDGGADYDITEKCFAYGADVVVAGKYTLFDKNASMKDNYARLSCIVQSKY